MEVTPSHPHRCLSNLRSPAALTSPVRHRSAANRPQADGLARSVSASLPVQFEAPRLRGSWTDPLHRSTHARLSFLLTRRKLPPRSSRDRTRVDTDRGMARRSAGSFAKTSALLEGRYTPPPTNCSTQVRALRAGRRRRCRVHQGDRRRTFREERRGVAQCRSWTTAHHSCRGRSTASRRPELPSFIHLVTPAANAQYPNLKNLENPLLTRRSGAPKLQRCAWTVTSP
jgi:hypothetical protein